MDGGQMKWWRTGWLDNHVGDRVITWQGGQLRVLFTSTEEKFSEAKLSEGEGFFWAINTTDMYVLKKHTKMIKMS